MLSLFKTIDSILDRITMYRVVLYYCMALLAVALFASALHMLPFSPLQLLFSTAVLLVVALITNKIFAWSYDAPVNAESVYITALILALIVTPVSWTDTEGILALVFISAWAIASKFIFAYRRRHIFNPAAFGVALSSFTIGASATWWVGGSLIMLPFVFVLGVLVIRKVRRLDLMAGFFAALCVSIFIASHTSAAALSTIEQNLMYTPAFFFAFAMLSEPLTTPPTRARRIVYGAIVGVLSAPATNVAGFFFTPELALLAGNIVSFLISAKERFMFVLVERIRLARGVYEFVFATDRRRALAFNAGQYIECTLDHSRIDQRGNRRYFTISSSPEDEHVRLGVKFYDAPSSFKRALFQLQPGGVLSASHVAGDFTLPRDTKRKLAFIAGGVGVTPFASMVRDLTDRQESRDTIVLYSAKGADEIAYRDAFSSAEPFGVKTIYVFSEGALQERVETRRGSIDRAMIEKEIPDWHERTFYLSGPHGMVSAVNEILREMGVPMRQIKKDFFPGLM